jgi:hypothetical protein
MGQQEDNELFNFIRELVRTTDSRTSRFGVKKGIAGVLMILPFGEMDSWMSLSCCEIQETVPRLWK